MKLMAFLVPASAPERLFYGQYHALRQSAHFCFVHVEERTQIDEHAKLGIGKRSVRECYECAEAKGLLLRFTTLEVGRCAPQAFAAPEHVERGVEVVQMQLECVAIEDVRRRFLEKLGERVSLLLGKAVGRRDQVADLEQRLKETHVVGVIFSGSQTARGFSESLTGRQKAPSRGSGDGLIQCGAYSLPQPVGLNLG
jgi:hypothetical protein